MKKSDLKTGMQFETRAGERFVVLLGTKAGDVYVEVKGVSHGNLIWYDNNLNGKKLYFGGRANTEDIIKVYEYDLASYYLIHKFSESCLIWERKLENTYNLDGIEYSESTLRSIIKKANSK